MKRRKKAMTTFVLKNADAADVAKQLQDLSQNQATSSRGTSISPSRPRIQGVKNSARYPTGVGMRSSCRHRRRNCRTSKKSSRNWTRPWRTIAWRQRLSVEICERRGSRGRAQRIISQENPAAEVTSISSATIRSPVLLIATSAGYMARCASAATLLPTR